MIAYKLVSVNFAPGAGFEPATNRLTGDRSTAELSRNMFLINSLWNLLEQNKSTTSPFLNKGRTISLL